MTKKTRNRVLAYRRSKITFILLLIIFAEVAFNFSSCNSQKNEKERGPIVYSLPPYPLTKYYIGVNPDSLAYIYSNFKEDHYITVSLKIGDKQYEGVKMRIRGDSSRELKKKSLKLKLPKGMKLEDGTKKINLNADYGDATLMHQYLSSATMNNYHQICFRAGYAPVFINDEYFGLYIRVENMDSNFLKSRNLSAKNNLYKATKDYACLANSREVVKQWEKKTNTKDADSQDLMDLIDQLNTVSVKQFEVYVKKHFYYNELVNIIALNMSVSNSSTYYHNYYLYHDKSNDKWRMFPWDMDKTFNPDHVNYNYQKTSWSEGKSSAMNSNVLIEKFLANSNMLSDLRNRIAEISLTYNSETYKKWVDSLEILIKPWVFEDKTNKIKSEEKWNQNLGELLVFIENRPEALLTQIDNKPLNFMVDREVEIIGDNAILNWQESIDPNGLPITYTINYSNKSGFGGDIIGKIEGLKETSGKVENLTPGRYYFFIEASNGRYITYGHDIRNYFEIP
jgi:hypothetical protein